MNDSHKFDGAGTNPKNISTEHQAKGDPRDQSDTLDRPADKTHAASEFDPARDVGKAEPGAPKD